MRPATRFGHLGRAGSRSPGFVNPPVHRGSTMLYASCAEYRAQSARLLERGPLYGIHGSATHHALEDMVAGIEGGARCQLLSSGLAAVTVALLAYLGAGDHALVTDSAYGPTRRFCDVVLSRMGVAVSYYNPCIDEAGLAALMQPNTRVVYAESPGSHSFEVQDIPALARAAHAGGAKLLLDNTWGIGAFLPFAHGADVSVQALTKYVGGHSDVMLGGITVNSAADWAQVRGMADDLGHYASPDDCWLALRGARTLGLRLERQMQSGLEVAAWLAARAEVLQVLHPALPGAPGHELWRRDFTGASSLFAVVFQPAFAPAAVCAMIDGLALFGIGSSWGGFESLMIPSSRPDAAQRRAGGVRRAGGRGCTSGWKTRRTWSPTWKRGWSGCARRSCTMADLPIRYDSRGLVPAVAQQHDTGEVLMLAWMNAESIAETLATGRVCYWSRSRGALWRKGETSGQAQRLVELRLDCDGDTLLLLVDQTGAACHTGQRSCFFRAVRDGGLKEIASPVADPAALYGA